MIAERIYQSGMLAEVASILIDMSTNDIHTLPRISTLNIIPQLATLFLDDPAPIMPFANAWLMMFGAISRLDDLQDSDPIAPPFPVVGKEAQYLLLFGSYIAATSMLDNLDSAVIPEQRIARLRRFWSDMLLRMVSGQYADVTSVEIQTKVQHVEYYQQLVQAKTGATFTLAFGGTAMLCCDDPDIYETLSVIGELYGTLLQYGDDLNDMSYDGTRTMTFPHIVHLMHESAQHQTTYFWHVYQQYIVAIDEQLILLPELLRSGVRSVLLNVFQQQAHR